MEYLIQDTLMFCFSPRKDQNVVQVDYNIRIQHIKKHLVHYPLKCARRIHEAKRHDQILVGPIPTAKSRFVHILRSYRHMEVPITQVQAGKVSSTLEPSQ